MGSTPTRRRKNGSIGYTAIIRLKRDGKAVVSESTTPSADVGYLKLVLTHAAAVHGINLKVEPVDLARVSLKRLGLTGKPRQRDRRPTPDEIKRARAPAQPLA